MKNIFTVFPKFRETISWRNATFVQETLITVFNEIFFRKKFPIFHNLTCLGQLVWRLDGSKNLFSLRFLFYFYFLRDREGLVDCCTWQMIRRFKENGWFKLCRSPRQKTDVFTVLGSCESYHL